MHYLHRYTRVENPGEGVAHILPKFLGIPDKIAREVPFFGFYTFIAFN